MHPDPEDGRSDGTKHIGADIGVEDAVGEDAVDEGAP